MLQRGETNGKSFHSEYVNPTNNQAWLFNNQLLKDASRTCLERLEAGSPFETRTLLYAQVDACISCQVFTQPRKISDAPLSAVLLRLIPAEMKLQMKESQCAEIHLADTQR